MQGPTVQRAAGGMAVPGTGSGAGAGGKKGPVPPPPAPSRMGPNPLTPLVSTAE